MSFTFRRAIREQTPLLIGLVGPSSSGKTYSSLRLATGIQSVVGGRIAGIDTEARRMLHYADKFNFDHTQFDPPHSSLRYLEAIKAAVDHGAKTVIIDSQSHEHEGVGGYLESHENELTRLAGDDLKRREKMNFSAWIKPAQDRRKLINALLQLNANFIFCFRAKEKTVPMKDADGKLQWIQIGWQAIAGDDFVYEMVTRCLLQPNSQGIPDWSQESMKLGTPKLIADHVSILTQDRQLDEGMGQQLAQWAAGIKQEVQDLESENIARETARAAKIKLLANLMEHECFTDEMRSKTADLVGRAIQLKEIDKLISHAENRIRRHKDEKANAEEVPF